jgi:hypothetical protein
MGLLAMTGLFVSRLQSLALTASAFFYTGYGLARLASLILDGLPEPLMVWVTALELAVGALCFIAVATSGRAGARAR